MTAPQLPDCHPAAELFPLLNDTDLADLAADIEANGLLESIWYDTDGLLLDGRNRWRACQAANVEPTSRVYDGDEPTSFVLSLNMQRRHLTTGQKAMVAVDALPLLEAEARERQSTMARKGYEDPDQPEQVCADLHTPPAGRSTDKAAEAAGTSGRAVAQAKRVTTQAPDLAEQVRAGGLSLNAAEEQLKRRAAEKETENTRSEQMQAVPANASGDSWWMFHGDFRDRLTELPPQSVDLLITEPPAPAEFMPMVSGLASKAERVLAESGVAVVLIDPIFLQQVLDGMGGRSLKYGWVYAQPTETETKVMPRHVLSGWRMWVAWSNGPWPQDRLTWHPDLVGRDGGSAVEDLVAALSPKGGTVCDPFTGAGWFGVAALSLGRRFVGAEMDSAKFQAATGALQVASA